MDLPNIFKKIINDPSTSWVLFKNGTCIMLLNPQKDLQAQALKIIKEHGSVTAGTPTGDFEVTKVPEIDGWIVTGDFLGIMIYVSNQEAKGKDDFEIGLIGRTKRELDGKELEVVYVENKRKSR